MKFSIRDLLLVTVIVALGLGWLADHWRQIAKRNEAEESALTERIVGERYKSILEDEGYRFIFEDGHSCIRASRPLLPPLQHPPQTSLRNKK